MNLPSTTLHLEIAKVGDQYILKLDYTNGPGSVGGSLTEVVGNREALIKYIGVMVGYVPQ